MSIMFLVNPLESCQKYVYHYTKIDTALKYILKTGTLRLNSFAGVNDPRESKTWTMTTIVDESMKPSLDEYDDLSNRVSDTLKKNVKLVCFSKDRESAVGKCHPEGLIDRGYAKPSMWHHYSNAHNGVCLVFDIEKLDISFKGQVNKENLVSGSVIYSDDGIVPDLSKYPFTVNLIGINSEEKLLAYLSNHLDQWLPDLFLKKLMDWSNEEEYRWIYFDNNPEPICLTFDNALEAIVIGEGVSKNHYDELITYCGRYEAGFAHLQWRNGYPALGQLG